MIKITFPDGAVKEYQEGTTPLDIAKSISEGLARACVAAKINDVLVDMTFKINEDAKLILLKFDAKEGKEVFWHSSAHVLAQAVTRLFPKAVPTIGPSIENGFYYDFDHEPFTPEDLILIEKEMDKIVNERLPIVRKEISKSEAEKLFKSNEFKQEIIEEYSDSALTVYEQGEYSDLCRGPHLPNTSMIKAFKLTKVSGAYWRGDATNKSLARIYGISYPDKKLLTEYLTLIEEAEKRDHRKIGKELELFMFHEYSPGSPFFLPKGTVIYNELLNFIRDEYRKRNYKEVITPQMFNKKLWETSGHWDFYKENMFINIVDGQEFALKPMNCPSHLLIFKNSTKSYKDLPLRIADFCMLHRNELKGVLGGLMRVRKFAQDDAHIFCTEEQIEEEVFSMLEFIKYVWEDIFAIRLEYYLSTKPKDALGSEETWTKAEAQLANALNKAGIAYKIKAGDGAFYGPKIDIDLTDALGRKWQCPTCQLDFNLPQRFEAEYEGQDGKKHQVVMIHRAVLGSLERFTGIIVEHFAGKFPLWLSPVQVKLLPIADRHVEYCNTLQKLFSEEKIRVEIDSRSETINKKVRDAQLEQVNYILVIGDKELESNTVNIRTRDNRVVGAKDSKEFMSAILEEIKKRNLKSVY
ncbi:MAG: threonine--tRNA ligase [Candidatus Woesearchaeota archaeon]|jgi:threonyl-tRNA synthetase